jgi:hypothetical protein
MKSGDQTAPSLSEGVGNTEIYAHDVDERIIELRRHAKHRQPRSRQLNVSKDLDGKKWVTNSEKSTVYLPKWVLLSHEFRSLSHPAKTALIALCYQDWGNNNGCFELGHTMLREWGIGSKSTLKAVRDELLASGLVSLTAHRQFLNPGGYPDKFAVNWRAIPDSPQTRRVGITPIKETFLRPSAKKRLK